MDGRGRQGANSSGPPAVAVSTYILFNLNLNLNIWNKNIFGTYYVVFLADFLSVAELMAMEYSSRRFKFDQNIDLEIQWLKLYKDIVLIV